MINILLIEDNLGDVYLTSDLLKQCEELDFLLIVADTLEKGLKHLVTEVIDVILLDLNLPDSRGIATFRTVHRIAPQVSVIIMSILSDKEVIYQALQEGAQNYLIKGQFDMSSLICALRYAIWSGNMA